MLCSLVLFCLFLLSEGGEAKANCSEEASGLEAIVEPLIKGYVEGMTEELANTKAQLKDVKQKLDATNRVVAFHAYHSSDPFSVASQGTIVYNSVTSNIGGGYDRLSGIFTAPLSGTYSFFANCMAVTGTAEYASIILNGGTALATCYSSRPNASHAFEQGATQGIAHLNAGDKVWVRIHQNAQDVRGNYWQTFSGFLIHADV